ncbi:MAG: AI-2E family transporter [Gammaproteobacteria bacterium]|nr:AI-2E family transporter [Gammaproteobacteria bacterium]
MTSIFNPVKKLFLNTQFTAMIFFIAVIVFLVIYMGGILAPFFAAVVVAYLLEGVVFRLTKHGWVSRFFVVNIVFLLFLVFVISLLIWAVPEIGSQGKQAAANIPVYLNAGQDLILKLPESYPNLINKEQALTVVNNISGELSVMAKSALSGGVIAPLVKTLGLLIYLILVPVMVYFLLKDKHAILAYLKRLLPLENPFLESVWQDVDMQIGNYIRGKFIEIVVIWFASYIAFVLFGLDYAMLLSFMVGISVLIPYIGAAVVTLPVMAVAFVQWGIGSEFYFLMGTYFIIQILDGNVLVPLIFSEAVSIHPVAIIIAVLLFGGIWGFWGVFFAIPLATVVNAIINAWYDSLDELEEKA